MLDMNTLIKTILISLETISIQMKIIQIKDNNLYLLKIRKIIRVTTIKRKIGTTLANGINTDKTDNTDHGGSGGTGDNGDNGNIQVNGGILVIGSLQCTVGNIQANNRKRIIHTNTKANGEGKAINGCLPIGVLLQANGVLRARTGAPLDHGAPQAPINEVPTRTSLLPLPIGLAPRAHGATGVSSNMKNGNLDGNNDLDGHMGIEDGTTDIAIHKHNHNREKHMGIRSPGGLDASPGAGVEAEVEVGVAMIINNPMTKRISGNPALSPAAPVLASPKAKEKKMKREKERKTKIIKKINKVFRI